MEARAQARYIRVTPMKARRVVDLIRGMDATEAQAVLRFAPQAASVPVGKVLDSAIANAAHNYDHTDVDSLYISEAYVDEGPTLKRFRPRAQGRALPDPQADQPHHRGRQAARKEPGNGPEGKPARVPARCHDRLQVALVRRQAAARTTSRKTSPSVG